MFNILNNSVKSIIDKIREEGITSIFKRTFHRIKKLFNLIILIHRIKKLKPNLNLNVLLNFLYLESKGMLIPFQNRYEILKLLKIVKKIRPKFILEIGTAKGATLFLFSRIAAEDAVIISVDLPGGNFGKGYPKWKIPLFKSFTFPKQKINLIRANSHAIETLNRVKSILKSNRLDFLFIDGDHSYEGVKKDFEMYSPLIDDNGIISLHDIADCPLESKIFVSKFWNEIKEKYSYTEIIEDKNQKGAGIGILKRKI